MESEPTRVLLVVSKSTIRGYPHTSISSRRAFKWTIQKIVCSNTSGFRLHFLHVQVPDEDKLMGYCRLLPFGFLKRFKGFDDMDSIYASPEDFKSVKQWDRIRGLHL